LTPSLRQLQFTHEIAFEEPFAIDNRPGILVAYDTPDGRRRSGARVTVDWFA